MKSILILVVAVTLLLSGVHADTPHCSFPTDAILVANQRSTFTNMLDDYICNRTSTDVATVGGFTLGMSAIISDSFGNATVITPFGTTIHAAKSGMLAWLIGLRGGTFAGFADHIITNIIIEPLDSQCSPSRISFKNSSPNLLRINFGRARIPTMGKEISREQWIFAKVDDEWLIESYTVHSNSFYNHTDVSANLYGGI
jgi:hypothetical protein